MNKNLKNVLLYLGIPIVLIFAIFFVSSATEKTEEMKYSEIVSMIKENKVSEFELNLYSGELTYVKREDGQKYRYSIADPSIFYNDVNDAVMKIKEENKGTSKDIVYNYK